MQEKQNIIILTTTMNHLQMRFNYKAFGVYLGKTRKNRNRKNKICHRSAAVTNFWLPDEWLIHADMPSISRSSIHDLIRVHKYIVVNEHIHTHTVQPTPLTARLKTKIYTRMPLCANLWSVFVSIHMCRCAHVRTYTSHVRTHTYPPAHQNT